MTTFIATMAPHRTCRRDVRLCLSAMAVAWACVPGGRAPAAADDQQPTGFTPADISIGEPIALPVAPPAQSATQAAAPEPADRAATPAIPGSGWLGVTVAESTAPGRWLIADVVAGGPAARAGIAVGDELRAVNGITLQSLEEASLAVTSIAAGQQVRIAVARADAVRDLTLMAEQRPAAPVGRGWQGAEPDRTVGAPPVSPQSRASAPLPAPLPAAQPAPAAAAFAAAPQPFGAAGPVSTAVPPPAPFAPAGAPPPPQPAPRTGLGTAGRGRTALGVRTLPIDPGIQARFNLPDASGAYVIGVVQDLPASKAGVPPGSVIVSLDDRPVRSPIELTHLVTSGPVDRPVAVQYVLPGGESKRAEVVLQSLDVPLERVLIGSAPAGVTPPPSFRVADRPASTDAGGRIADARPLIEEIRLLRTRLERLERGLQALGPTR